MNKSQLTEAVMTRTDLTKRESEELVSTVFTIMQETLATGEKVQVSGFGTFEVKDRSERKIHSLNGGGDIDVPATKTLSFTPAKSLKEKVRLLAVPREKKQTRKSDTKKQTRKSDVSDTKKKSGSRSR